MATPTKQPYKDVTILLVEDDDVDAMTVERALEKLRILNPYIRAKNGVEALEILHGNDQAPPLERPYLILLDLNMPLMGGIEFLQEVRKDPKLKDSVVFVLTTSSADEDKVAAYNEHIAGYIVKYNVKQGFSEVIEMLDSYWRVVVLPG